MIVPFRIPTSGVQGSNFSPSSRCEVAEFTQAHPTVQLCVAFVVETNNSLSVPDGKGWAGTRSKRRFRKAATPTCPVVSGKTPLAQLPVLTPFRAHPARKKLFPKRMQPGRGPLPPALHLLWLQGLFQTPGGGGEAGGGHCPWAVGAEGPSVQEQGAPLARSPVVRLLVPAPSPSLQSLPWTGIFTAFTSGCSLLEE